MTDYLPDGQLWLGFDESLICVAASIEKRMPGTGRKSVFDGCSAVVKRRADRSEKVFGRHLSSFKLVPHKATP